MSLELGAILGVAFLVILNIVGTSFWAGGINQKVLDHDRRLGNLEDKM